MSLQKKIGAFLCSVLPLATFPLFADEPRNCYVKDGEIICQTTVDPFSTLEPAEKAQVVYRELDDRNGATMGFGGSGYVDGQSMLTATIKKNGTTLQRQVKMRFL
jgi:hypothetical protein